MSPHPLFCDRCAKELQPGTGDFFVVRITAVADPAPPDFTDENLAHDLDDELQRLYAELDQLSAQEAVDQVFRRVTLYLCNPCFREWIEKPTG